MVTWQQEVTVQDPTSSRFALLRYHFIYGHVFSHLTDDFVDAIFPVIPELSRSPSRCHIPNENTVALIQNRTPDFVIMIPLAPFQHIFLYLRLWSHKPLASVVSTFSCTLDDQQFQSLGSNQITSQQVILVICRTGGKKVKTLWLHFWCCYMHRWAWAMTLSSLTFVSLWAFSAFVAVFCLAVPLARCLAGDMVWFESPSLRNFSSAVQTIDSQIHLPGRGEFLEVTQTSVHNHWIFYQRQSWQILMLWGRLV